MDIGHILYAKKNLANIHAVIFSDGTSLANLKGLLSYKKNLKFLFTFIDREEVEDNKT